MHPAEGSDQGDKGQGKETETEEKEGKSSTEAKVIFFHYNKFARRFFFTWM